MTHRLHREDFLTILSNRAPHVWAAKLLNPRGRRVHRLRHQCCPLEYTLALPFTLDLLASCFLHRTFQYLTLHLLIYYLFTDYLQDTNWWLGRWLAAQEGWPRLYLVLFFLHHS